MRTLPKHPQVTESSLVKEAEADGWPAGLTVRRSDCDLSSASPYLESSESLSSLVLVSKSVKGRFWTRYVLLKSLLTAR